MQLNLGEEGANSVGSAQAASTSEDLTKMTPKILVPSDPQEWRVTMEDIVKKSMLSVLPQVLKPVENSREMIHLEENAVEAKSSEMIKSVVEGLAGTKLLEMIVNLVAQRLPTLEDIRKVVKEEIQSAKDGSLAGGNWNSTDVADAPNERNLCLKFNEAPCNVLTGKEIKAQGGNPVTVAIYDEFDQVIENGPESSAKVEILFLDASENDKKHIWSHEDLNNRIIEESDKTRPHFAKNYFVYLERGRVILNNAKLANGSKWTKSCKCRLGARVVDNLSGIKVQVAFTEPFLVSDSRGQLYIKHHPPSLSDDVWRLERIARDGGPCKRLKTNRVLTVKDLLFLHSINPSKLKEIIGASDNAWKVIENHAQSCIINDTELCMYTDSSEPNMPVVFDVVGKLKAVIRDSQYVQNDRLSEAEKARARELLCSAFEHRDRITLHADEMALMQQLTRQACDASLNSIQGNAPADFNPAIGTSRQAETPELVAPSYQHPMGVNSEDGNPPVENVSALNKSELPPDLPRPNLHGPTSSISNPAAGESGAGDSGLINGSIPISFILNTAIGSGGAGNSGVVNTDVEMVDQVLIQAKSFPLFSPPESFRSFLEETHNQHASTERQLNADIMPNTNQEQTTESGGGGYFPIWDYHYRYEVMPSCRQRSLLWFFIL